VEDKELAVMLNFDVKHPYIFQIIATMRDILRVYFKQCYIVPQVSSQSTLFKSK
jgi:hypothetical protein